VSTKQPVSYHPASASPVVIEFGFGGAFNNQTRFVADGIHVCEEISVPSTAGGTTTYELHTQREATPSAEQWKQFWCRVNRLQISAWKPKYAPSDLGMTIFDGSQWYLTLTTQRRTTKSSGDNTYPAIGHPKRTTLKGTTCDDLIHAFQELLDSKRPSA
jgi:hypothetical protein